MKCGCSTSIYYCRSTYMLTICKYALLRYRFKRVRNWAFQLKGKIITTCTLNWGLDRIFESRRICHRITHRSKERNDFWANPSLKSNKGDQFKEHWKAALCRHETDARSIWNRLWNFRYFLPVRSDLILSFYLDPIFHSRFVTTHRRNHETLKSNFRNNHTKCLRDLSI
jgi:hypothetical protein